MSPRGEKEFQPLKPCPFCGGEAVLQQDGTSKRVCIVACSKCSTVQSSSDSGVGSGAAWNRRAKSE